MNLPLRESLEKLRTTYWFVPGLMALLAILLAIVMITVDKQMLEQGDLPRIRWIFTGSADGARQVLATIAGSMITVAGVSFSITIVALTLASTQFGPRLLYNFMRDTGNQIVLGTFVATFLYSLLVLRQVEQVNDRSFIPHLSITIAVLLSVASIGVLIYFIHHASESIHLLTVLDGVAVELKEAIGQRFPTKLGSGPGDDEEEADNSRARALLARRRAEGEPLPLPAHTDGYLSALDDGRVMEIAREHGLLIELEPIPGDFVVEGSNLALVWAETALSDEVAGELRAAFAIASRRSPTQDIRFLINELVEVAVRALSPGINDPFTAIDCIDRLSAALCDMGGRRPPSPYRFDETGTLRLVVPILSFETLLNSSCDMIRRYGRGNVEVTHTLLCRLAQVARCTDSPRRQRAVLRQARLVVEENEGAIQTGADRRLIEQGFDAVRASCGAIPGDYRAAEAQNDGHQDATRLEAEIGHG